MLLRSITRQGNLIIEKKRVGRNEIDEVVTVLLCFHNKIVIISHSTWLIRFLYLTSDPHKYKGKKRRKFLQQRKRLMFSLRVIDIKQTAHNLIYEIVAEQYRSLIIDITEIMLNLKRNSEPVFVAKPQSFSLSLWQ